jgi:cytochrome c oxidase subunit 4
MAHSNNNNPNILTPHIAPMSTYLKVAGALFALTFLTVIAHQFKAQLGMFASAVAFLIALIKASLVVLWFMHLKDDNNMNRAIFGSAFAFLFLLWVLTELDIITRVFESSPL